MSRKVDAALSVLKAALKPGRRAAALVRFAAGCAEILQPRRSVAEKNLEIVFPGISKERKAHLIKECYESLAWTGAELFGWQDNPELINEWTVEVEGRQHIDNALKLGRGVLFLTAHIGNWEHAAAWIGRNYGSYGIAQHNKSPFQKELISRLRASSGLKVIGKEEPMTRIVSVLKKNGLVGIVSDQHAGGDGVQIPLFGKAVSTAQGLAVFSWLTKAPIIPGRSIRLAPYRFKMQFLPPIAWEKLAAREETLYDISRKANKVIEKWVLDTPGQWLWLHKRFKEAADYK